MITILSDIDDVSSSYERGTLRITEQLNNRRNVCQFRTIAQRIDEGKRVLVYDTMRLRQGSNMGTDTLYPLDTYEFSKKYRAGDKIYVDINGANQRRYTIDSVDHAAREIVLTANLAAAVTELTKCGKRIFGGVNMRPSDEEIGNDNTFLFSHSLQDWNALFNLKNVAGTFMEQYPREIAGRILRTAVAVDTTTGIDDFEDPWTEGGVARTMEDETTDFIDGGECQITGATGAGSATWTLAVASLDLSTYDHIRFWWKMKAGEGENVSALKLRVGTDGSNYYQYNISHVGEEFEDCWSFESALLAEPESTTGTPDLSDVDWIQLVLTATASIPADGILFDNMHATSGGFTIENVARGSSKFENLPGNYIKPSELMEDISKRQSMYWFIDMERDVHLFATEGEPAPFGINTTTEDWGDLEIERDLETLRNRVTVRGSDSISESLYEQIEVADGEQTSFRLDYKPSDLTVYVDTGSGYVEKTVGVENLHDEADYEFMMNFQEKFVRNSTHATLDADDKIKFTYFPYIPIRVQLVDIVSVANMKAITGGDGIYDAPLIQDERLRTYTEARQRAQVELDLYSNAVVTCTFQTNKEGLHAGQIIPIADPDRNVNAEFVIQRISARTIGGEHDDIWSYDVTAASSMFGLIEFFQLLMKRSAKIPSDVGEGVELVFNIDDVLALADSYTATEKSEEFNTGDLQNWQFEFGDLDAAVVTADGQIGTGLRPSWYGSFDGTETGEVGIAASGYNTGKALKLEADTGGNGQSAKLRTVRRIPVTGATEYTVKAWLEIAAALTNVGTDGGFRLSIAEYDGQGIGSDLLQTTVIFDEQTTVRDFSLLEDTHTTHADAEYIEITVELYRAAGVVSVGELHLIESGTDGQTNPAVAGFAQTSA